jgi:hypothetical protein
MHLSKEDGSVRVCPICGCTESIRIKKLLSTKQIHNKSDKVINKSYDVINYFGDFESFMKSFKDLINQDRDLKLDFIRRFDKKEDFAYKGVLYGRERYFFVHYDRLSKSHRRCSITKHELAHVRVRDPLYVVYKGLICKLAKANVEGDEKKANKMALSARKLLEKMEWSARFIEDKISENLKEAFILWMLQSGTKTRHDTILAWLE